MLCVGNVKSRTQLQFGLNYIKFTSRFHAQQFSIEYFEEVGTPNVYIPSGQLVWSMTALSVVGQQYWISALALVLTISVNFSLNAPPASDHTRKIQLAVSPYHSPMSRWSAGPAQWPALWPRLDILGQREESRLLILSLLDFNWVQLMVEMYWWWQKEVDEDSDQLCPSYHPAGRPFSSIQDTSPSLQPTPYGTQVSSRGKKWNIGPTIPFM